MPEYPLVSVVIVNWNGADVLAGCLTSLAAQSYANFETILVDNGSEDDSIAVAEHAGIPVQIIRNTVNRGFCGANNQGIDAAKGEFIALLNNDAEAVPNWLSSLVAAVQGTPNCGMVASKILHYDDHTRIDKVGHLIYLDGQNRGRGSGEIDRGQYENPEAALWPDGCAALYSTAMIRQIGGFDEDFFAYADDADLGLRGRIAGWKAVYAPTAVVHHRGGLTLGRYSKRRLFLIERNRLWLVAKLFPWRMWPLVPVYFLRRIVATAWATSDEQGEAHHASRELGLYPLIQCIAKANGAALLGLPKMILKRAKVREYRQLDSRQIRSLLKQYEIPLQDLARKSL